MIEFQNYKVNYAIIYYVFVTFIRWFNKTLKKKIYLSVTRDQENRQCVPK